VSGSLLLSDDGTFTLTTELRITEGGSSRTEMASDEGEWSLEGMDLTLRAGDGLETTGRVHGKTITLSISRVPWLYMK
jgi:hypothetical protein